MEMQIVIFLAFTSVTLVINSFVIWLAYKAFSKATIKVTETIREFETSESALLWLRALEVTSAHAVSVTNVVRDQLANADPVLTQAHARFTFKLAKLDLQVERSLGRIVGTTRKVQDAISRPADRIGATLSGVREVVALFSEKQSADDASSRRT
jgi:hypothetical protein